MGEAPWAGLAFERQRLKEILLPAATKTGSFVKPVVPLNRPTITFVAGANGSGKTSFDPLEL